MSNRPNMKAHRLARPLKPKPQTWWEQWRRPLLALAALVVVVGCAAAIALTFDDGDAGPQTGFAETIGTKLPPIASPDPAIGMEVPVTRALNLEGDLVDYRDSTTPRLFAFFAHWCPQCQAEMPEVVAWLEDDPLPEGVEIVAVSTSVDETADNYPPTEWFDREGWPTTVLVDSSDNRLASGYGLEGFPYWVAVGADGRVVDRAAGRVGVDRLAEMAASAAAST